MWTIERLLSRAETVGSPLISGAFRWIVRHGLARFVVGANEVIWVLLLLWFNCEFASQGSCCFNIVVIGFSVFYNDQLAHASFFFGTNEFDIVLLSFYSFDWARIRGIYTFTLVTFDVFEELFIFEMFLFLLFIIISIINLQKVSRRRSIILIFS